MNVDNDGDEVTSAGRLFHTRAAATRNARSPTVDRRVTGTTSVGLLADAERRHHIISSGKTEAEVTVITEECDRVIVLLKLTTGRQEATRGLSAIAELLVSLTFV